jgi:hypothetical protein
MQVKLNQSLGAESSRKGDSFTATVINPVIAQDGFIAVPQGSLLRGRISGIRNSSVPGEKSVIRLAFEDLQIRGKTYPVTASISNVVPVDKQAIPATTASTARNAAVGAVISGGELSKIIMGGILGAGTGTVISLGAGGTEGVIPAGSTFTVRTNDQVVVR